MAFVDKDAVARILGLPDGAAFLRVRSRLELDHDFPLPLPTCMRPLRWRQVEIENWLALQGKAAADMTRQPNPTNVVMLRKAVTA